MDNLIYFYKPNSNQLHKVTDLAPDSTSGNHMAIGLLETILN
jgi:hypothetical protein